MARQETTAAKDAPVKKRTSPAQFFREVRQEVSKVTWPTRRETMVSTMMVFIMIAIMAVFFLTVDAILRFGIEMLLQLGS
jgi:preprotein translocase subunit SecE